MEKGKREAVAAPARRKRSGGGKLPLIILGILVAIVLAGYIAVCAVAASSSTIFPNVSALLPDLVVGGMTKDEARSYLEQELPGAMKRCNYSSSLVDESGSSVTPETEPQSAEELDGSAQGEDNESAVTQEDLTEEGMYSFTLSDLGAQADLDALTDQLYQVGRTGNFFTNGWTYLNHLLGRNCLVSPEQDDLTLDEAKTQATAERLAGDLSYEAVDTAWETGENTITLTKAKDGRQVDSGELETAIRSLVYDGDEAKPCGFTVAPAKSMTAQEIHDAVAGEMKNAGYDSATGSIIPEQVGAEFDVDEAQKLLDKAQPGDTVTLSAQIEEPTVTAAELEKVLFRDVLGTYTTHVGGTSGRVNNVRLSAKAINGYVLNSGDVFSYNTVVGKRTTAKGYSAAPAYVNGATVDEIGGGICQTSSTLYMATLLSNLEIVTRSAHRYIPSYITPGMDATVSWGGPEYEFRNDTQYPIRISASVSSGKNLTVTIYGTKVDDTYVKMTNEKLGTIPYETVYEDDPTLPEGTEKVKQTPYTGSKYRTYRNVYSGDGKLISSTFEASSNYKARDKIILRGTKKVETTVPDTPTETPGTSTQTPGTSTETPGTSTETPGTSTQTPGTSTETPGTGTQTPDTSTQTPATDGGTGAA